MGKHEGLDVRMKEELDEYGRALSAQPWSPTLEQLQEAIPATPARHGSFDLGQDVFDCRNQTRMSIGRALEAMKRGARIARSGWNGRGMYLVYQAGYPGGIAINENTARATGLPVGTVCRFSPYVMMRAADGAFVPWLCSQTDLLADDWTIVGLGVQDP